MIMMWEEEEVVVDLYGIRGKKYSALALSLILYCLLLSLLLINLSTPQPLDQKGPLSNLSRRPYNKPAPVRFATAPQPKPASPTTITPPPGGAPKALAKVTRPQKIKIAPPKLPAQPAPAAPIEPVPQQPEPLPPATPAVQQPQPEPQQQPSPATRHTFQSRGSWYKKNPPSSASTPAQTTPPSAPEDAPHKLTDRLSTSFRQFLDREAATTLYEERTDKKGPTGSAGANQTAGQGQGFGSGAGDGVGSGAASAQARRVGHELFLSQLVYTICDASHQNPLQLHGERIPLHIIVLRLTINRNRKVERVVLDQASPEARINTYLEELVKNTNLPQLPADWEGETLTVPLRVRIEVLPQMNEIRLIPASW